MVRGVIAKSVPMNKPEQISVFFDYRWEWRPKFGPFVPFVDVM